jgi:hypothetical protein
MVTAALDPAGEVEHHLGTHPVHEVGHRFGIGDIALMPELIALDETCRACSAGRGVDPSAVAEEAAREVSAQEAAGAGHEYRSSAQGFGVGLPRSRRRENSVVGEGSVGWHDEKDLSR